MAPRVPRSSATSTRNSRASSSPRLGARAARRWYWRQAMVSIAACIREPAVSTGAGGTDVGGEGAHAGSTWSRNRPSRGRPFLLAASAPVADRRAHARRRHRRQRGGLFRAERYLSQEAADRQRRPLRVDRCEGRRVVQLPRIPGAARPAGTAARSSPAGDRRRRSAPASRTGEPASASSSTW